MALHHLTPPGQAADPDAGSTPGKVSQPILLFAHPTGFHGMVWAPVGRRLSDVADCWALDIRGHGDSSLPASGTPLWDGAADDVLAVIDWIVGQDGDGSGGHRLYGVGHSMGGAALLLTEQTRPGTWGGLWCYEPIVFPVSRLAEPPSDRDRPAPAQPVPRANPMAAAARRRKAVFPSRETALLNYGAKPPLGALDPEALEAYVTHGFRDLPEGAVELKCAPETEARFFESGISHDVWNHLGQVHCPTTVAAGGDGAPPAQIAPKLAAELPAGRFVPFPELSHFGPMEEPATIAAAIRSQLLTA